MESDDMDRSSIVVLLVAILLVAVLVMRLTSSKAAKG